MPEMIADQEQLYHQIKGNAIGKRGAAMTLTLDFSPEVAEQFRHEAARRGQETGEYVKTLVEGQLRLQALQALKERKPPRALADLKPRIPSPPGSNGLEQVIGQWPGEETDEEIQTALDAIS
jgi:hypothetical protein